MFPFFFTIKRHVTPPRTSVTSFCQTIWSEDKMFDLCYESSLMLLFDKKRCFFNRNANFFARSARNAVFIYNTIHDTTSYIVNIQKGSNHEKQFLEKRLFNCVVQRL